MRGVSAKTSAAPSRIPWTALLRAWRLARVGRLSDSIARLAVKLESPSIMLHAARCNDAVIAELNTWPESAETIETLSAVGAALKERGPTS